MIDRFKRFLEREFKAIRPTQAAMEYREDLLTQLLEKEQDLRIKGMTDDELIYEMCIDSLGDVRKNLEEFENRNVKVKNAKRTALIATVITIFSVLLVISSYLVVSFAVPHAWAKSWLIIVGGLFAGVGGVAIYLSVVFAKKKKYLPIRALVALCIVLLSVFVFLVLQILFGFNKSWLTFLVMVVLILGVDAVISDITGSKLRYISYAIFIEVFAIMLYIILGITMGLWHPEWIIIIAGLVADALFISIVLVVKSKKKKALEQKESDEYNVEENEEYYTQWKDR